MRETFEVRALVPSDASAYKALRDDMLALHPTSFSSDAITELARPAASYLGRLGQDLNCNTIGAERGSILLGALTCERDPREKVRHIAHLVGMMVHPRFERQGIGRALLAVCLERLREAGQVDTVVLSVTKGNQRAIDLYERAGFSRYGMLPDALRVDGEQHAKALMRLKLNSA